MDDEQSRDPQNLDRRDFLRLGTTASAGLLTGALATRTGAALPPLPVNPRTPEAMPTRNLGRTGYRVGIFGLGARAKKASAFIVMAIMGGALLPKVMGAIADKYDVSRGFVVPAGCFAIVALYGLFWPRLSNAQGVRGLKAAGGH